MTLFALFAALAVVLVLSLVLWGAFLQMGLRWAGVPSGTLPRATFVGFCSAMVSAGLVAALALGLRQVPNWIPITAFGALVINCIVSAALIAWFYQASLRQAQKAWLPTLLTFVTYAAVFIITFPTLFQSFIIPTNAMAPTLIGDHVIGVCPECGAPSYGSTNIDPYGRPRPREQQSMICRNFHTHSSLETDNGGHSFDRIIAAKFLKPRRWDIAVFRKPGEEEVNYVKRVVGMPGETVTIRDGAIFIDGKKLEPPPELKGIQYVTTFPDFPYVQDDVWGSPEKPAVLGPDEYFTLGDHSTKSLDSRLWEEGAEGHPPYAVPKSHLIGVTVQIYWPFDRIRTLR